MIGKPGLLKAGVVMTLRVSVAALHGRRLQRRPQAVTPRFERPSWLFITEVTERAERAHRDLSPCGRRLFLRSCGSQQADGNYFGDGALSCIVAVFFFLRALAEGPEGK